MGGVPLCASSNGGQVGLHEKTDLLSNSYGTPFPGDLTGSIFAYLPKVREDGAVLKGILFMITSGYF